MDLDQTAPSCAYPESFVRGGPTMTTFFSVVDVGGRLRGEEPNTTTCKRAIIGPLAKRHLNGVSLACR